MAERLELERYANFSLLGSTVFDGGILTKTRLYNSTHEAMEALRTLDGPGQINGGRLYRIALEKKGIFKPGGIPIEYARALVDTPSSQPWNHGWTR